MFHFCSSSDICTRTERNLMQGQKIKDICCRRGAFHMLPLQTRRLNQYITSTNKINRCFVGTDVLDGNPQKLVNSLDGSPRFAGPSIRGTPATVLINETIFIARRCVCKGPSRTPVPTTSCIFSARLHTKFYLGSRADDGHAVLPYK